MNRKEIKFQRNLEKKQKKFKTKVRYVIIKNGFNPDSIHLCGLILPTSENKFKSFLHDLLHLVEWADNQAKLITKEEDERIMYEILKNI